MKIGIISDTHDNLRSVKMALQLLFAEKIETLLHCGDWVAPFTVVYIAKQCEQARVPVFGVIGNNVGDLKAIEQRNGALSRPVTFAKRDVLEMILDKKRVAVYHGHDDIVKELLINSTHYDVICIGHNHTAKIKSQGQKIVINPGTTSFARNETFLSEATIALYDTQTNEAKLLTYTWEDL